MKTYDSPMAALVEYLHYLKDTGQFDSVALAKRMEEAGVAPEDMISDTMFRLIRLGDCKKIMENRAVAACQVFGIAIAVKNPHIPANWKPKKEKRP